MSNIRTILSLLSVVILLSGCATMTARQIGGNSYEGSHKVDSVIGAYTLPDKNIIFIVNGRIAGSNESHVFSLLVQRAELERVYSTNNEKGGLTEKSVLSVDAKISVTAPDININWVPIKIIANPDQQELEGYYVVKHTEANAQLGELWGRAEIFYIEPLRNGKVLHWEIHPDSTRITHEKNWKWWLPITVPVDIVTLPVQAIWALISAIALSGSK